MSTPYWNLMEMLNSLQGQPQTSDMTPAPWLQGMQGPSMTPAMPGAGAMPSSPAQEQNPYTSSYNDFNNMLQTMLQNNPQWQAMNQPEEEDTPEEKEAKRKAKIWRNVRYGLAAVGDAMQNYARGINPNTIPQGFVQMMKQHENEMAKAEKETDARKTEVMAKLAKDIENRAWEIYERQTPTQYQKGQLEHWKWEEGKPPKEDMQPWQKEGFDSQEEWKKYHGKKRGLELEKTESEISGKRTLEVQRKQKTQDMQNASKIAADLGVSDKDKQKIWAQTFRSAMGRLYKYDDWNNEWSMPYPEARAMAESEAWAAIGGKPKMQHPFGKPDEPSPENPFGKSPRKVELQSVIDEVNKKYPKASKEWKLKEVERRLNERKSNP